MASAGIIASAFDGVSNNEKTLFNNRDEYFLFEFAGGALPKNLYGWAQLSVSWAEGGRASAITRS